MIQKLKYRCWLVGVLVILIPLSQQISVAQGSIVVDADRTLRQKPEFMGGTMIEWHDVPSPLVVNRPINFQRDLRQNRVQIVRLGSFPSPRNPAQTLADFDRKVAAIQKSGAVPLFYAPIKPGLPYLQANGQPGGTIASHIVALVKHYSAPPFKLQKQYWEVGNEPDIGIDYKVQTTQEYIDLFRSVHNALVAAGLRDRVTLMGPVTSRAYRQGAILFADQLMDDFLAQCHDIVDVITWHHYANQPPQGNWQYPLLNQASKLDNIYKADRPVDRTNQNWNSPTAYMGMAALLDRMKQYRFGRQVAIGITEHNAAPVHSIQAGLWNLAVMHFLLYSDPAFPVLFDNTFIFNQYGTQYGFPLYTDKLERNYSNWALWINGNLRGTSVLPVSVSGNLNESGNPYLLVTATKGRKALYVEVINRHSSPITDTVIIRGTSIQKQATIYRMAEGITPEKGTKALFQPQFSYTFPPYSATIFKLSNHSEDDD